MKFRRGKWIFPIFKQNLKCSNEFIRLINDFGFRTGWRVLEKIVNIFNLPKLS